MQLVDDFTNCGSVKHFGQRDLICVQSVSGPPVAHADNMPGGPGLRAHLVVERATIVRETDGARTGLGWGLVARARTTGSVRRH
jgi:hypothetical protein